LSRLFKLTKLFIKNHPSIIFTKTNKDNITIALDKNEYIIKMEDMVHAQDTYINIKKNPINKLMNSARNLLTRWTKNNYITTDIYKRVFCSDGILPRAYGLPKIHKPVTILESSFLPLITLFIF